MENNTCRRSAFRVKLWFLFTRINLSPFTKDFRGEEHSMSLIKFFYLAVGEVSFAFMN